MAPARCGSSRSQPISFWPDKHLLTCDNDRADSREDGWIRQPPIYQESLRLPKQHADHRPGQTILSHRPQCAPPRSLSSRNAWQNRFETGSGVNLRNVQRVIIRVGIVLPVEGCGPGLAVTLSPLMTIRGVMIGRCPDLAAPTIPRHDVMAKLWPIHGEPWLKLHG